MQISVSSHSRHLTRLEYRGMLWWQQSHVYVWMSFVSLGYNGQLRTWLNARLLIWYHSFVKSPSWREFTGACLLCFPSTFNNKHWFHPWTARRWNKQSIFTEYIDILIKLLDQSHVVTLQKNSPYTRTPPPFIPRFFLVFILILTSEALSSTMFIYSSKP